MTKTLVLVVDRDDDFGVKANIDTPLIGMENATKAAIAFGIADPEDSDVNALLAAMSIYDDLKKEGEDVEISLICGDQKVGHKSDSALVREITEVIDTVKPDRAILVGDGAEDEYIYPIISSRVQIDSVKKVYVKQAPGIEGSLYIFSKMISDPGKRKRFLVPIGALLCLIAFVYLIQGIYAYVVTGSNEHIFGLTTPIVVLIIGGIILMYGYNAVDKISDLYAEWKKQFRRSSISIFFTLSAIAFVIIGIIIGVYSIDSIMGNGFILVSLTFVTYVLWPLVFAVFLYDFGQTLNEYVEKKKIGRSFMTRTISVLGVGFLVQGLIDFVRNYLGYAMTDNTIVVVEIVAGVIFALMATLIQMSYKKYFDSLDDGTTTHEAK